MFRTDLLSIIRSFSLHTQQWFMSYRFPDSSRAVSGRNWFRQFRPDPTGFVSSVLIVLVSPVPSWSYWFHQFLLDPTGFVSSVLILLVSPVPSWSYWFRQFLPDPVRKLSANLYDMYHCCVYSEKTPDAGQRNCPKYVEFYSRNKFEKLVHLVGFVIRMP